MAASERQSDAPASRDWMRVPIGQPGSKPPKQWEEGLWALDAAVRAAISGGWTDDEIRDEVAQLVKSHRGDDGGDDG